MSGYPDEIKLDIVWDTPETEVLWKVMGRLFFAVYYESGSDIKRETLYKIVSEEMMDCNSRLRPYLLDVDMFRVSWCQIAYEVNKNA